MKEPKKILGRLFSKDLDIDKNAFRAWRDPEGNPFSFFYMLVMDGIKKHVGLGHRYDRLAPLMDTFPMGVVYRYDVNRNYAKQVAVAGSVSYPQTLPPVIDIQTLYVDQGINTKELQAAVRDFASTIDSRIEKKYAKRWSPIIRTDPLFFVTHFKLNNGLVPEWIGKCGLWIPAEYDEKALHELTTLGAEVIFKGSEETFEYVDGDLRELFKESTLPSPVTKPEREIRPYNARVTNPMGGKLYMNPNLTSKQIGTVRRNSQIKVRKVKNGFGYLGERIDRWIQLSDIAPVETNYSKKKG